MKFDLSPNFPPSIGRVVSLFLASCGLLFQPDLHRELGRRDIAER